MTFTFTVSAADWGRIAPELVLAGMALLLLLADLLLPGYRRTARRGEGGGERMGGPLWSLAPTGERLVVSPVLSLPARRGEGGGERMGGPLWSPVVISGNYLVLAALSLLGLAGAFAATIVLFLVGDQQSAFNSMIRSDFGSLYAYIIILSASALGIMLSPAFLKRLNLVHQGEYYALFLLATIGMMLMASATSFLTVFLGLELLSLALYILCSFVARRKGSQESGMKYFLLSSFASAFLLYGIALTYGATGGTAFDSVRTF